MASPTHRALLIANAEYGADLHNLPGLKGPRNDAQVLRDVLCDNGVGLFQPSNVQILTEATEKEIRGNIDHLFGEAGISDTVLLYYSGHGRQQLDGELYLCARDTISNRLPSTAVGANWINRLIDNSRAAITIVLLDCCHSGAFKGVNAANTLSGKGRFILTSTRDGGLAMDSLTRSGASLFTATVAEGLYYGAVDSDGDGLVTLDDLYSYVHRRLTSVDKQTPQIPHKNFDGDGNPTIARRVISAHARATNDPRATDPPSGLRVVPLEIHLGEVQVGDHLPLERVTVSRQGNGPPNWTADASESWIQIAADKEGIFLRITPTFNGKRANVWIRDRSSGEINTVRIHVKPREKQKPRESSGKTDALTIPFTESTQEGRGRNPKAGTY
jgi:Caspase domain